MTDAAPPPDLPTPDRVTVDGPRTHGIQLKTRLKSPAPYLERFRAIKASLNQPLEVRVMTEGSSSALFEQERDLLFRCNHPSLPPVVRHGVISGRPFYAIPLRASPRMLFLSKAGQLNMTASRDAAVGLLSALACLQREGFFLGGLHPSLLTWDPDRGAPGIPFPLALRGYPPYGGLKDIPADLARIAASPAKKDLVCWAVLCYRIIAQVNGVFPPDGSAPVPVRDLVRAVPRPLAAAIDACLRAEASTFPQDAEAVLANLGDEMLSPVAGRAIAPPPARAAPAPKRPLPSRAVAIGLGAGLAMTVTLAGLAWTLHGRSLADAAADAPGTPAETSQLRSRLSQARVTPEQVDGIMLDLQRLASQGGLPRGLNDLVWFRRVRTLSKTDKAAAARELSTRLARLSPRADSPQNP